ncbi:hypothetical protein HA466_0083660 [Hirschfeldia incana]|nr:hypothetical protein HA466_0083660 [Hirschfeldia incana]
MPVSRGPLFPTNVISFPNLVQGSFQKLIRAPSPGSKWNHCKTVCLSCRICLNNQEEPEELNRASSVPQLQVAKTQTTLFLWLCNCLPCDSSNIFPFKRALPEESVAHFVDGLNAFLCIGSQLAIVSFLELRGRPR